MDFRTKQTIEIRARAIVRLAEEALNVDCADEFASEAFRYGYLVLSKPRAFLEAFHAAGTLLLNPNLIDEFLWTRQRLLPGEPELSEAERELIFQHNCEVEIYESERRTISVAQPTIDRQY